MTPLSTASPNPQDESRALGASRHGFPSIIDALDHGAVQRCMPGWGTDPGSGAVLGSALGPEPPASTASAAASAAVPGTSRRTAPEGIPEAAARTHIPCWCWRLPRRHDSRTACPLVLARKRGCSRGRPMSYLRRTAQEAALRWPRCPFDPCASPARKQGVPNLRRRPADR